jgi:hypothetical protein
MHPVTGYQRIATEEAFAPPELVAMWQSMLADGTCDDPGFVALQGFFMKAFFQGIAEEVFRLLPVPPEPAAVYSTGGVPWVWKDSMVFSPQAWPLARSASVQVIVRQSGASTSRATGLASSIRLPPGS